MSWQERRKILGSEESVFDDLASECGSRVSVCVVFSHTGPGMSGEGDADSWFFTSLTLSGYLRSVRDDRRSFAIVPDAWEGRPVEDGSRGAVHLVYREDTPDESGSWYVSVVAAYSEDKLLEPRDLGRLAPPEEDRFPEVRLLAAVAPSCLEVSIMEKKEP